MQPSICLLPWFVHCYIPRSNPTCWSISPLWVCQLLLQLVVVVFYPLWWPGLIFYSLEPIIVNHLSLECRNKVPHILILTLQWVLLWVVCPAIDLMLLPLSRSLHRPQHLALLVLLLLGWSHSPILIFLVISRTSSC